MADIEEIKLSLPYPPSVNRLWRASAGGRMYRSKEYNDWRDAAGWAISSQAKGKGIKGEYILEIRAVKPDKRRRDLGNLEKAISDLLQEVKVIEDDCLCQDIHILWVKLGPECLVIVRKYEAIMEL